MSLHILFPHLRGFRLLSSHREAKRLILTCERVTRTALCPVCGTTTHRIHNRYQRAVWDLSVQNVQVILHLHVRKFYCDHPACPWRIFTERLPQVTARAMLRFLHALAFPPITPPRVIGLDEWAWKRGQRYGAIVVDLERKKPIALLPDRSQQTVAHWLKRHPTIKIVARDRSKEFAAATIQNRACGRTHQSPETDQTASVWPSFPTCNTASCQLPNRYGRVSKNVQALARRKTRCTPSDPRHCHGHNGWPLPTRLPNG